MPIRIRHENIRLNVEYAKSITNKQIIAVVKNNAYNTGLEKSVDEMQKAGISFFCTSDIREAVLVRKFAPLAEILATNTPNEEDILLAKEHGIHISINSYNQYLTQKELMQGLKLHLKINSGMNRFGINDRNQISEILSTDLDIVGLYTHFSQAEEDRLAIHLNQVIEFEKLYWEIAGIRNLKYIHAENTATFLQKLDLLSFCTHVRVGILLYGYSSTKPVMNLTPTVFVSGRIVDILKLRKGDTLSYGKSTKLQKDTDVGIVDLGYGNGIIKERASVGVLVGAEIHETLRISMSHTFIDTCGTCKIGDEVIFYNENIRVDEIMRETGAANSYQMACLNFENN